MSEAAQVQAIIGRMMDAEAQVRVAVMAQVMRELLDASGKEAELAMTLVIAELFDATE